MGKGCVGAEKEMRPLWKGLETRSNLLLSQVVMCGPAGLSDGQKDTPSGSRWQPGPFFTQPFLPVCQQKALSYARPTLPHYPLHSRSLRPAIHVLFSSQSDMSHAILALMA